MKELKADRFTTATANATGKAERIVRFYSYGAHGRRAEFEAVGWIFAAELGFPHGAYSVLREWRGEGEPGEGWRQTMPARYLFKHQSAVRSRAMRRLGFSLLATASSAYGPEFPSRRISTRSPGNHRAFGGCRLGASLHRHLRRG